MHDTLSSLVERALTGNHRPLEFYLRENSRLPGPRANLELANDLGYLMASSVPRNPEHVRSLLDYFANGDRKVVPNNTPAEFIMICGIVASGACAAVRPEWRRDTLRLLEHYACNPYFRVREGVASSYQHLIAAEPQEIIAHLIHLVDHGNYLQQCSAITAIAEQSVLYAPETISAALRMHRTVLNNLRQAPLADRRKEEVRVLRRTLGYTLSVVTAAAPEEGFALMRECASWNDNDIHWILRENLKKKRLAKFAQDTAVVSKLLA